MVGVLCTELAPRAWTSGTSILPSRGTGLRTVTELGVPGAVGAWDEVDAGRVLRDVELSRSDVFLRSEWTARER